MRNPSKNLALLASVLVLATAAVGQVMTVDDRATTERLSSGPRSNHGLSPRVLWSQVVEIPGATSLQLEFSQTGLPTNGDKIIVTSLLDGERMILTSSVLEDFSSHTAWFNGPSLSVSLVVAPDSTASASAPAPASVTYWQP